MNEHTDKLFKELAQIIERGKKKVTSQVNNTMTMVYWYVGKRINEEILNNERADYGKQIVSSLMTQLVERRMMQFASQFQNEKLVNELSQSLSWTHFIELLPLKKQEAKLFYAKKISEERWSVRATRK